MNYLFKLFGNVNLLFINFRIMAKKLRSLLAEIDKKFKESEEVSSSPNEFKF